MGIVDKDNDDEFSYNDFLNNFPKYDTEEVNQFIEKSKQQNYRRWNAMHNEDSDPFDGESSVSLDSSFESD